MNLIENIPFDSASGSIKDSQGNSISYAGLKANLLQVSGKFLSQGLRGDRVVLYADKNVFSLSCVLACLHSNLVYVPVSKQNPIGRLVHIATDAQAQFLFTDSPECIDHFSGVALHAVPLFDGKLHCIVLPVTQQENDNPDLAAILYTSGSTGFPKGVALSHSAMNVFVEWCMSTFKLSARDTVASIAPFNFDLSVFDVFATLNSGSNLYLFDDTTVRNAMLLAQKLAAEGVTVVYSTPTLFQLLCNFGKLHKYDWAQLRLVLFAGEVYLPQKLFELMKVWTRAAYYNLYGPTESNVCTYYKVTGDEKNFFPIGCACPYAQLAIIDENNKIIYESRKKGQLLIGGDSMYSKYWNDDEKTKHAWTQIEGKSFYKSGDIVYKDEDGMLVYSGRADRMIKRKGYRIELNEVERILNNCEQIHEAVVIGAAGEGNEVRIIVFYTSGEKTNLLTIKQYCIENMPEYMIPDSFIQQNEWPKTSSGKIDLQALRSLIA